MLKYQADIASLEIKKVVTFLYDCETTDAKTQSSILEEREFDKEGRLTKQVAYQYTGELKSKTIYMYGPDGDITYQNLYNADNAIIQTRYFDKLGNDTLTRNFMENGQLRNEMRKVVKLNREGFPAAIEELDNQGRTHSLTTYSYDGEKLLEETFTRVNMVSGDEVATQVIQYNEFGDRVYMSTSTASIINDEVSMEYEYDQRGKIKRARLMDKNSLLIRDKVNTFYDNGTPRHISDYHLDPSSGDTTQIYEENFNENEKIISHYMRSSDGTITQSGEFVYEEKKLLESIEFNKEQTPNYICTFLEYEYYN